MSLYTVLPRAQSFIYFCTCNTPNILDETGTWQQLENPKCDLVSCNFALVVSEQCNISTILADACRFSAGFRLLCALLELGCRTFAVDRIASGVFRNLGQANEQLFFFLILILASTFPSLCITNNVLTLLRRSS